MLKKRARAHSITTGYVVFGLINTLSFLVIPGSAGRLQTIYEQAAPGQPFPMPFDILMVPSLLLMIAALWLLISRRRAFIEKCGA